MMQKQDFIAVMGWNGDNFDVVFIGLQLISLIKGHTVDYLS